MTQKPFGVKQLNVIGAAGTPTIESAGDLNIGGQQVAITTNTSIAGVITATAFSGDGSSLTGINTFSGDYNDLTNTPTIPTNNNQLTNGAGYISTSVTNNNQLTNGSGYVTSSIINSLDASNLSSGTIPDARFPATLPAVSGANLTNLPAASVDQNFSGIVTATSFQANSTTGDGSDRGYTIKYYITSSGASAYRFAGPGVLNSTNNPTLYFHRGFTYILENSTGGSHPFALRVTSGGSSYSPGGSFLTGSTTGTQILTVPFDGPSSIVYQCTLHGGMLGTINFVS
jgi:hypothetical protein